MTLATDLRRQEGDLASVALALARRFDLGATLWCVAPGRPDHAHRLAATFADPARDAARSLLAVALPAGDPVASVRAAVRPGDVVAAVADGDDDAVVEIARRAPAWGVITVWIGAGPRPAPGSADHLLWDDDHDAVADGQLDRLARGVRERTHACLAEPGLLGAGTDEGLTCVTCADEGRLAEVVAVDDGGRTATVRIDGGLAGVDVSLIDPPGVHDLLLVHAGSVLCNLDAPDPGEATP